MFYKCIVYTYVAYLCVMYHGLYKEKVFVLL